MNGGDTVEWDSMCRNGRQIYRRTGIIVVVVPAGVHPTECMKAEESAAYNFGTVPRKHESYLVSVEGEPWYRLYWPIVSRLRKVNP
jgi:hypothetical protein